MSLCFLLVSFLLFKNSLKHMMKKIILFAGLIATSFAFAQINSGNPTVPFGSNTSYDFGMLPTNLPNSGTYGASTIAGEAYNEFKTNFIVDCGTDKARVKFDTPSETVSEGIAYTMLLAAYAADQITFNKLWAYYKFHSNANGVMHWKISGCNSVVGQNGATDAELDAAMALIVANHQWGSVGQTHNYKTDAIALIKAIRSHEVNFNDKTFENGDAWGNNSGCRNPSYQAPAYAKVFAKFLEENGEGSHVAWAPIATATKNLLIANSNNTSSGLASNWSKVNGQPDGACQGSGTGAFSFGYDACRAPWRQGTDFIWFGTASGMQTIIDTQIDFWISKGGPTFVKGGNSFSQSGTGGGDHNGAFIGMIGAQSLAATNTASHRNFLNQIYNENKNVNTSNYFSKVLRCLGLFVQTGNFWNPYSDVLSTGNKLPSVDLTSPTVGQSTCSGTDIFVSANASDTDGSITKVEFYNGNTLLHTDVTAPYEHTITGVNGGLYIIKAIAYDDLDAFSSTPAVSLSGTLPNVDLGNGPIDLCSPAEVTLNSGVVIEGAISAVWEKDNTAIAGEVGASLLVKNEGTYKMTVSAPGCTSKSGSITVTSSLPNVQGDIFCPATNPTARLEVIGGNGDYKWYNSSSSTNVLGSADFLEVTPTTTTTYYVEDVSAFEVNVGPTTNTGGTTEGTERTQMKFVAFEDFTLESVDVIKGNYGGTDNENWIIEIKSDNNNAPGTVEYTGETTSLPKSDGDIVTIPVNVNVIGSTAGTTYWLTIKQGATLKFLDNFSYATPYSAFNGSDKIMEITGGRHDNNNSTSAGMAFNWKLSAGKDCDRVSVEATLDCAVGLNDKQQVELVNVFPNPSNGTAVITSISNDASVVTVLDLQGNTIDTFEIDGNYEFASGLDQGLYILQVREGNNIQNLKFIKK